MNPIKIKELVMEQEIDYISEMLAKVIYTERDKGIVVYVGSNKDDLIELAKKASQGFCNCVFEDFQTRIYYKNELKMAFTTSKEIVHDLIKLEDYKINYISANYNDNFIPYSPLDLPKLHNMLVSNRRMFIHDELILAAHAKLIPLVINFRRAVCEFSLEEYSHLKPIEFRNQKASNIITINELVVAFKGSPLVLI